MKKISILVSAAALSVLSIISCSQPKKTSPELESIAESINNLEIDIPITDTLSMLRTYCYTCHSPSADHDNRLAPPMIAIKKHYITAGTTSSQFIKEVKEFVAHPEVAHSKMPGALRRFGLMPAIQLETAEIEAIASYIYHHDIEEPDWFEDHFKEESKKHGKL